MSDPPQLSVPALPPELSLLQRWLESKQRKACLPTTVRRYEREVDRVLIALRGEGRATPKIVSSPLHPAFSAIFERYLAYRQELVNEALLRYPGSAVPPEALVMLSKVAQGLRAYSDTALDQLVHAIEERTAARGRPVHLSSHMFRRSGATMLEEALLESPEASRDGVYRAVQEFLRHENLATTMRYLESNPQRQRKALDLYGEALPWAEPRT